MAKKKRGRKMPAWKKYVKAGLGIFGTVLGTAVATSPMHRGITTMAAGNPQQGIEDIVFDTTGMIPSAGNYNFNVNRLVGTGITVAVGIGFMKLFKFLSRRV